VSGGTGGSAGQASEGRRLPLPCTAPLPTGYCFVSDSDDYVGEGKSTLGGGVFIDPSYASDHLEFRVENSSNLDYWTAIFEPPVGAMFAPGLYEPAAGYPFHLIGMPGLSGLSVHWNGRACDQLTGKFAVEELEGDPVAGLVRASITFEQHCDGWYPALRGVINFMANGTPDTTPVPTKTISLEGKIFRAVYDSAEDVAYGLDAANRRLAQIDLASGDVTYVDIDQEPANACLDAERERLFVVNKGSNSITEYDTSDLTALRDITWSGMEPTDTHFEIHCSPERLYVVDGAWAPGLFTVEHLDDDQPVVTDHTEEVMGVGGLVLNEAATDLYYWYQYGWSAGILNTAVHRVRTSDLSELDVTDNLADYARDPLDAPILLDESRGLIFSKNKIFDATNLTKVVYSLPSAFDILEGATENVYALDSERGLIATKNHVYELGSYDIVAPTLLPKADQLFFDASGGLWYLSISKGQLLQQRP
jgi:hypothetical protein